MVHTPTTQRAALFFQWILQQKSWNYQHLANSQMAKLHKPTFKEQNHSVPILSHTNCCFKRIYLLNRNMQKCPCIFQLICFPFFLNFLWPSSAITGTSTEHRTLIRTLQPLLISLNKQSAVLYESAPLYEELLQLSGNIPPQSVHSSANRKLTSTSAKTQHTVTLLLVT